MSLNRPKHINILISIFVFTTLSAISTVASAQLSQNNVTVTDARFCSQGAKDIANLRVESVRAEATRTFANRPEYISARVEQARALWLEPDRIQNDVRSCENTILRSRKPWTARVRR